MGKLKTQYTDEDVSDFIETFVTSEQKKNDSYQLIELMESITGHPAKMWGPTIIGFGNYHYRYASGHEGDAPLLGFSPRKSALSLYVYSGLKEHEPLLEGLGKFTIGKACMYVKKLADIDIDKLSVIMKASLQYLYDTYPDKKSIKINP